MKDNACPLPPNNNGKGEQWAEKRERGEKAGLEREEKSPQSVIGPDLLLFGLLSPSGIREESKGMEFIKVRSSESACSAGGPGLIPGLRRSPGEAIGYPLQYSGLENPMDCIAQSIGSQRVRHDWVTFTFKELRKSQRFRVSGRRELTVTFSETLGLWLTEDYAQWHVCTSVTLPCSWGVLCISSSELKPRSFLWDKSLIRLSQGIWGVSFFFHSLLSNCLSLMGKGTVRFNFSVKCSK